MKTKILLSIVAIMAFMLLLIGCEAETPGEPRANETPETYISEASPGNVTTISFYGTDNDGFVDNFSYKWDTDADWTVTSANTVTFENKFADQTEVKVFMVKGIDNTGAEDPTPAEITLTATNALPNTEVTGGPEFGQESGEDVIFTFTGTDGEATGSIAKYEYTMDDLSNWQETPADYASAAYYGLSTGAHIFYVRAIDNLGGVDATPAQIAFIVVGGKFAPTIVNMSAVADGGGWFAGVDLTFAWDAVTADYYGKLAEAPFSYGYNDATNYDTNPITPLASGWTADATAMVTPTAGAQKFYLKVRDTAGGVALLSISFTAADAPFDQGILVVNGVSPVYGTELTDRIDASAFWNTYTVDFWDLFGSMSSPSITLPASVNTYAGGGGPVPADVIGKYSTVVWLGNNYQGDIDHWNLTPAIQYLNAGGNIILSSRLAADFCDDALTAYAGIGWREGAGPGSSGDGVTLSECKTVFPGLVDMTPSGSSLANVFSGGGYLDSYDDNEVTNWDGTYSYTNSALTHTLLFAHRSSATIGSFGFVRGVGIWAHPNFAFSSTTAINEFPATADEKKGNFILINGRNYRYDITSTTANYTFILQNMCGEQ